MTDHTLSISAALREAQLQRLEASLASKSAAKHQPQVEAPKDKDELVRDGPLTVALQPLISTAYGGHPAPADVLGRSVVEALVSIALGVLLAWFTTRLIIWFFSPDRYRRDHNSEDGARGHELAGRHRGKRRANDSLKCFDDGKRGADSPGGGEESGRHLLCQRRTG